MSYHVQTVTVILVRPRNPLNIGAAARAMANFGFPRLTVVSPYPPHWHEAKSAIGAHQLLEDAVCVHSLEEALRDSTLVLGTGTLAHRKPEQPVVALPDLAPIVQRELARGARIALVFGPEKHGLTREDLSYCHLLVHIPTHPQQPSINLGQAVALCLYELAARTQSIHSPPEPTAAAASTASSARLELLAGLIEQVMDAARYSPPSIHEANRRDLRLVLRRLNPAEPDLRRILGLFRRILWRLRPPE